jgi:hypothetical protein
VVWFGNNTCIATNKHRYKHIDIKEHVAAHFQSRSCNYENKNAGKWQHARYSIELVCIFVHLPPIKYYRFIPLGCVSSIDRLLAIDKWLQLHAVSALSSATKPETIIQRGSNCPLVSYLFSVRRGPFRPT